MMSALSIPKSLSLSAILLVSACRIGFDVIAADVDDVDAAGPEGSPDASSADAMQGLADAPSQPIDAMSPPADASSMPVTVTFRQGVNGYNGTRDTFIDGAQPDVNLVDWASMIWDLSPQKYPLLRFEGIFGVNPGQIPPGANIMSATLTITMNEFTDTAGSVHPVVIDWDDQTTTFNNFGPMPGAQIDDYGPAVATAPIDIGVHDLDVTTNVAAWVSSPADNRGWIFVAATADSAHMRSSERGVVTERPILTVVFLLTP